MIFLGKSDHSLFTTCESFSLFRGENKPKLILQSWMCHVAYNGIIGVATMDGPDFLHGGVTFLKKKDASTFVYEVREPLSIRAVEYFLRKRQWDYANIFFSGQLVSEGTSSSSIGDLLDLNVGVAFTQKNGTTLGKFLKEASKIQNFTIPKQFSLLHKLTINVSKVEGTGHRLDIASYNS